MSGLARSFRFVRYVPPARILRRLSLMAAHRLADRVGVGAMPIADVALAEILPEPLFRPRYGNALRYNGDELVLEFLGRHARFASSLPDWDQKELQLWRMMLHYMEWLEPLNAEEFARFACDWIDCNGTPSPGDWRDSWNAYAISIRVVVWLQQLARHSNSLPLETTALIGQSAASQLDWLERHLETDIGGNHLIKNIKALLWGSACFVGVSARRWRATGIRLLLVELERQILPDGVHYERSPAYHDQVLADLLECRSILGSSLPTLDESIARMAQAAVDLAHPDGRIAQFNDAGLAMAYAPSEIVEVMARLDLACPAQQVCFSYPVAGYFGLHSPAMSLIADCGRIAPDDLPAHGHGDILSFELSRGAQRVFVDQGVYEYVAGPRRQASRSTASHNTLWVEDADQAEFFDAFRMGRRPRAVRANWRQSEGGMVLEGHHDGYRYLPGHPIHHRRIIANDDVVAIEDRLETERAISAKVGFLLHPAITVTRTTSTRIRLSWPDGSSVFECDTPMECEPATWWPDMGVECQTNRITIKLGDARQPLRCTLTFAER